MTTPTKPIPEEENANLFQMQNAIRSNAIQNDAGKEEKEMIQVPVLSMAPMEGVTTRVYREAFRRHFTGVDRYYTPFLAATHTHHFKQREKREIEPYTENLVPQILTGSSEDFIWAAKYLREKGYREVNLNTGCPYPTVFTKGKGAGMLQDPGRLDAFLDKVFSENDMPGISLKTRIGITDPSETEVLAEIFAGYPFAEVIVHPRVREEYYTGNVHREAYEVFREKLHCPVAWNGDIKSPEDADKLLREYPGTGHIMIGRALISDPSLARQIRGGGELTDKELRDFLEDLRLSYAEVLFGERDVLFKMKEIWSYLGGRFAKYQRALLDIKKSKTIEEYQDALNIILEK